MMKKMDWIAAVVDDNDDEEGVLMKWVKKKSLEVMEFREERRDSSCGPSFFLFFLIFFNYRFFFGLFLFPFLLILNFF